MNKIHSVDNDHLVSYLLRPLCGQVTSWHPASCNSDLFSSGMLFKPMLGFPRNSARSLSFERTSLNLDATKRPVHAVGISRFSMS
jgi:hypothetical protein